MNIQSKRKEEKDKEYEENTKEINEYKNTYENLLTDDIQNSVLVDEEGKTDYKFY